MTSEGSPPSSRAARRQRRLRDELSDEQVAVPLDGVVGDTLLPEIDHARHPPVHERHVATYGALVTTDELAALATGPQRAEQIVLDEVPVDAARRLADGRGAFLVLRTDGTRSLACFEHSIEYEANLVALARHSGVHVVQRTGQGHVKIITPEMVIVWDGVRWLQKPHARSFRPLIARLVPDLDMDVLAGLLELCVHWLSPGFRGATLVWSLHRRAVELGGLDHRASMPAPSLDLRRREHYAAMFSLHGQIDGATLVDPDGRCHHYGTTLVPSHEAVDTVPPHRGTRHTSARRYSYDHPGAVVFVVSEDGPVSVFLDGARIVLVSSDPAATSGERAEMGDVAHQQHLRCPNCRRTLVIDLPRQRNRPSAGLTCPVCDSPAGQVAIGATARGVSTSDSDRWHDHRRPESEPAEGS